MTKEKIILVVLVAVLAGGLVWAGLFLTKTNTIVVDNQGRPVGAVSSALDVGPELGINGVQRVVARGSFVNASSTFISFQPEQIPASSTISFIQLDETGVATSTIRFHCGTAPTQYGAPTKEFFVSDLYSTSTPAQIIIANASTTFNGLYQGSEAPMIGPNDYFICAVKDTNGLILLPTGYDGVTGNQNTFDGTYKVEFTR